MSKTVLITGSSGLVGSACVRHFDRLGWAVRGIDNGGRRDFFGPDGDVRANLARLAADCPNFVNLPADVRNGNSLRYLVERVRPGLVIHAAAQPSHDLAASDPLLDFAVNAQGTLNLLEAVRQYAPDAAFVFLSTNKVYGDAPNRLPLVELATRYDFPAREDYARPEEDFDPHRDALVADQGIDEGMSLDQSLHSLFGVSKAAADLYVQEYGRYFGLKTCCLRAGCLTGGAHAGAVQHGFLAYLARCVREGRPYTVYGHKGKQVRDQLHARDVARACELFAADPRCGEVYNLGGGRANSVSVLEAIDALEQATGESLEWTYDETPRKGDHVVWLSDTSKFRSHYPDWSVTTSLAEIIEELAGA